MYYNIHNRQLGHIAQVKCHFLFANFNNRVQLGGIL